MGISAEKCGSGPALPLTGGQIQPRVVLRFVRSHVQECGVTCVVERAQHAGNVTQRRMLRAALAEGSRRLSFEIDDHKIIAAYEYLPQVIVTVVTGLESDYARGCGCVDHLEQCVV